MLAAAVAVVAALAGSAAAAAVLAAAVGAAGAFPFAWVARCAALTVLAAGAAAPMARPAATRIVIPIPEPITSQLIAPTGNTMMIR
jgi:hypothetical protein